MNSFDIAMKFLGTKEVRGAVDNPQILAFLRLDNSWPQNDEVAWCSGFANYVAWLASRARPKSLHLRARSWLNVGIPIDIHSPLLAQVPDITKNTVAIFSRGSNAPGPEVLDAQGHVAFYNGHTQNSISVVGGNQSDSVSIQGYPMDRLLGMRYLPPTS